MGRKKAELLTAMQLAFVAAFEGDGAAAAKTAGAKNPAQYAYAALQNKAVKKAITDKQAQVVKIAGRELGKRLAKCEITDGILHSMKVLKDVTVRLASRKTPNAAVVTAVARATEVVVKSYREVAELEGHIITRNLNLDRLFEGRSEEELVYFAEHGYFPGGKPGEPGTVGSESPGQGTSKPN